MMILKTLPSNLTLPGTPISYFGHVPRTWWHPCRVQAEPLRTAA